MKNKETILVVDMHRDIAKAVSEAAIDFGRDIGLMIPQDTIVTDLRILQQKSKKTDVREIEELKIEEHIKAALPKAWTAGAGLAAIQIGVPLQFAYYVVPDPKDPEKRIERRLINPVIVKGQFPSVKTEGCLSLPGKWYTVSRFQVIFYTTEDLNHDGVQLKTKPGDPRIYVATGFEAQLIQHEIDHMNGMLCFQRQVRPGPKVGRNDPCPVCAEKGIKIKYKKCAEHFQG
jgi:peptide deformylase